MALSDILLFHQLFRMLPVQLVTPPMKVGNRVRPAPPPLVTSCKCHPIDKRPRMQEHKGLSHDANETTSATRHPEVADRVKSTSELRPKGIDDKTTTQVMPPKVSGDNELPQHRAHAAVALELFCGSAGLSHACHTIGFRIVPIDWKGNKHVTKMPITRLDLSTPKGQQEVWNLLATLPVKYVHMGHPCGTY